MSKHTPGPWHVDDLGEEYFLETNHKYGIGAPQLPTYRLAKVEGFGDESLATARLIAAAPELLEALEDAHSRLALIGYPADANGNYHKHGEWTFSEAVPRPVDADLVLEAFHVIRDAIAKSAGGQS
jgi:hypothetical protein